MTYSNFISEIKRTQSGFAPTRERAMQSLWGFWISDSGKTYGTYLERMSFDIVENARQRQNKNRWGGLL